MKPHPAPGIVPNFFDPESAEREHREFLRFLYFMRPSAAAAPESKKEPEPMLLSINEASKRLRVRHDRVAALVASGKLPSVQVGKREKIRPADLEALLERGDLNPPRRGRPRSKAKAPASRKIRKVNLKTGELE